jgi:hypothetical protein
LLMSDSASLQPSVTDSVIVLFTSTYTGSEQPLQTHSKHCVTQRLLRTGSCSDYLTRSIVPKIYNREAALVLLHMRHRRCTTEVKAASSRSTEAFYSHVFTNRPRMFI